MAASKPTTIDSGECRGGFACPLEEQVCDHLVSRVYERPKRCLCNGLISPLRVGWSKGTLDCARVEALAVCGRTTRIDGGGSALIARQSSRYVGQLFNGLATR